MDKAVLKSKTFWISLVTLLAPLFPGFNVLVQSSPDLLVSGLGAVFMFLRFITKDKVSIV